VSSKERAQQLHKELLYDGIHVDSISGDQPAAARAAACRSFRSGRTWVLVATDLIARGWTLLRSTRWSTTTSQTPWPTTSTGLGAQVTLTPGADELQGAGGVGDNRLPSKGGLQPALFLLQCFSET